MGLDAFTDDDDEENNSSRSLSGSSSTEGSTDGNDVKTTDNKASNNHTPDDMSFYGSGDADVGTRPMERKGAMSSLDSTELSSEVDGEIAFGEDRVKLHLPIFPIVTRDKEYEQGSLYRLSYPHDAQRPAWARKVVSCTGVVKTTLGEMNKELAMFMAGSVSKQEVMENFDSRLGQELTGETEVYVSYMADVFFLRDMAQADMEYRSGDLLDRDKIADKVIRPKQLRSEISKDNDDE